ncbi:MAG: hypothetical protein ACE5R6_01385 [Candidatus Heimdallarchaeota archaeon]
MIMNAKRRLIILGIAATLILVSIWGLQSRDQAREDVIGTRKPQELYCNQEQEPVLCAWLELEKKPSTPETYVVELTEEDLAQFPTIQIALQEFAESNLTRLSYKTSEQEAREFQEYIFDKYKDSCEDPQFCTRTLFKYQEEFYRFGVAMPEDRVSTAAVPEVPLTSGALFLTGIILVLNLHDKKKRKRN